MSVAGRGGHPDPALQLDAYLDGQLAGPERAAFELSLRSDPVLAAHFEAQQRLDGALRGMFVVPPMVALPLNGHPTPAPAPGQASADALSGAAGSFTRRGLFTWGLVGVAVAAVSWLAYTSMANRRQSFADVYRTQVLEVPAAAAAAAQGCPSNSPEESYAITVSSSVRMKQLPKGAKLLRFGEARVLSKRTLVIRTLVDDRDVLIFADRIEFDSPETASQVMQPVEGGLHLFRRDVGPAVLYELSPFDKPRLIGGFEYVPTGCCGDAPPATAP